MPLFVKPKDIMEFLQAVDPASASGRTVSDAWRQFLVGQTGGDGGLEDLERNWLRSEGASGETLADLWSNYLARSGFASGSFQDRMRNFFDSAGSAVTFVLLQEDGTSRFTLEDSTGNLLLA